MTARIIILILLLSFGTIQCINSCYECSFLDRNRAHRTCRSDSCVMKCGLDHEPCTEANYCLHDGTCCQLKGIPSMKYCSCPDGYEGKSRCAHKVAQNIDLDNDGLQGSKVPEILICNVEHSSGNVGKCTVRDYGEVECECSIVTETTTSPNIKEVIGEQSYRSDCVSITQSVSFVTISFLVMKIVNDLNHRS